MKLSGDHNQIRTVSRSRQHENETQLKEIVLSVSDMFKLPSQNAIKKMLLVLPRNRNLISSINVADELGGTIYIFPLG